MADPTGPADLPHDGFPGLWIFEGRATQKMQEHGVARRQMDGAEQVGQAPFLGPDPVVHVIVAVDEWPRPAGHEGLHLKPAEYAGCDQPFAQRGRVALIGRPFDAGKFGLQSLAIFQREQATLDRQFPEFGYRNSHRSKRRSGDSAEEPITAAWAIDMLSSYASRGGFAKRRADG